MYAKQAKAVGKIAFGVGLLKRESNEVRFTLFVRVW